MNLINIFLILIGMSFVNGLRKHPVFGTTLPGCIREAEITDLDKLEESSVYYDPQFRCVLACSMKKLEFMRNGKFNVDKFIGDLLKENDRAFDYDNETARNCLKTANEEDNECDVASSGLKCLYVNYGPDRDAKKPKQ